MNGLGLMCRDELVGLGCDRPQGAARPCRMTAAFLPTMRRIVAAHSRNDAGEDTLAWQWLPLGAPIIYGHHGGGWMRPSKARAGQSVMASGRKRLGGAGRLVVVGLLALAVGAAAIVALRQFRSPLLHRMERYMPGLFKHAHRQLVPAATALAGLGSPGPRWPMPGRFRRPRSASTSVMSAASPTSRWAAAGSCGRTARSANSSRRPSSTPMARSRAFPPAPPFSARLPGRNPMGAA